MSAIADTYKMISSTKDTEAARDIALLVARLALTWLFIYHGGGTLFGWFGGAGLHNASRFFDTVAHLHPATFFAFVAGFTELFGSIFVGLGIFGRLSALVIAGDMVIAMITVTAKNGIASSAVGGGYELNLSLAALALVVAILGTGRFSVDYAIKKNLVTK